MLGALVVALFLADVVVGRQLSGRVADAAACRLAIEDADVDVEGWPRSRALITHDIPGITVRADEVEVAGIATSVDLEFSDVTMQGDALHVSGGSGWVAVPMDALMDDLGEMGRGAQISEKDGQLQVSVGGGQYSILLAPDVIEGRLQLTPTGLSIGDRVMKGALAESLVERALSKTTGERAGALLGDGLELPFPSRIHLDGVTVHDDALRLGLTIDEGDPSGLLGRPGTCA